MDSAALQPLPSSKPKRAGRRRSKVREMIAQYQHDEALCRYKNKLCMNPRARKRKGGLHTFCEMHREAANRNQRRLDLRKRMLKRQLESEMLQNLNGINATSPRSENCSSPQSPASEFEDEMTSPGRDSGDRMLVPEPSSAPVALKDEDIYALRWLFAVDEIVKQHRAADIEMTTAVPVETGAQWT